MKIIANNKKAKHDYFLEDILEAGIALKGTEVKSIREGKVSIKEAYCMVQGGEIYIYGMHISPYKEGNRHNVDPKRTRKLLLHRREINRLIGKTAEKGYSLIPTKVYLKKRLVKVEIALGKGKKLHDKRQDILEKESKRKIDRAMKEYRW
ncbi:MAG: SsrA-binding protein SmpB [Tissierellia bacterium]|nr:SsrA-binding protein SmpB [Tissierellia bacterium]